MKDQCNKWWRWICRTILRFAIPQQIVIQSCSFFLCVGVWWCILSYGRYWCGERMWIMFIDAGCWSCWLLLYTKFSKHAESSGQYSYVCVIFVLIGMNGMKNIMELVFCRFPFVSLQLSVFRNACSYASVLVPPWKNFRVLYSAVRWLQTLEFEDSQNWRIVVFFRLLCTCRNFFGWTF